MRMPAAPVGTTRSAVFSPRADVVPPRRDSTTVSVRRNPARVSSTAAAVPRGATTATLRCSRRSRSLVSRITRSPLESMKPTSLRSTISVSADSRVASSSALRNSSTDAMSRSPVGLTTVGSSIGEQRPTQTGRRESGEPAVAQVLVRPCGCGRSTRPRRRPSPPASRYENEISGAGSRRSSVPSSHTRKYDSPLIRLFSRTSSATRPSISSRRPSNSSPNGPAPANRWTCPAGIAAGIAATTAAGSGHTASMRPASHARMASGISIIGAEHRGVHGERTPRGRPRRHGETTAQRRFRSHSRWSRWQHRQARTFVLPGATAFTLAAQPFRPPNRSGVARQWRAHRRQPGHRCSVSRPRPGGSSARIPQRARPPAPRRA